MALDREPSTRASNAGTVATGAVSAASHAPLGSAQGSTSDGARRMVPQVGPLAATAMVGALWLSATVMNAGWVRIAFAVAIVAALWLLALLVERGVSARVPAGIVASLWLSVVAIALAFNAGDPGVVIDRGQTIQAAIVDQIAPPKSEDAASPDAFASTVGQTTAAADALRGAKLIHQKGGCGSAGSTIIGRKSVIAAGVEPIPVTGGGVLNYRNAGGACGEQSRIALAGIDVGVVSEGVFIDTRASAEAGSDGDSLSAEPGLSASHAGSRAAADTIRDGLSQLGAAGGTAGDNSANSPINSVDSLGNLIDPQGHAQP